MRMMSGDDPWASTLSGPTRLACWCARVASVLVERGSVGVDTCSR
jgi:hypothetical protein